MGKVSQISRDSGIYIIINKFNNKFYIGSSKNMYNRIHTHSAYLKRGKHHNTHLQNAWNKYNKDSFDFFVICTCLEEDLMEVEQHYIDLLKPEYNKNLIVTKSFTAEWGEEKRLAQSNRVKLYVSLYGSPSWKEVSVYDLEGNFIKSVKGYTVLAEELGTTRHKIARALASNTGRYKNHQLRYPNDTRTIGKYKRTRIYKKEKIKRLVKSYLSKEQREEIIKLRESEVKMKDIMGIYKCSRKTIYNIVKKKGDISSER